MGDGVGVGKRQRSRLDAMRWRIGRNGRRRHGGTEAQAMRRKLESPQSAPCWRMFNLSVSYQYSWTDVEWFDVLLFTSRILKT